ncbi:unnamed protein product [Pieris macdunnoughi]|uniref:Uncharacterized protein n=1 Tax=Pieris macdunnoughi TaxID=345717 RepID=A0A821UHA4_9NEOP|nr:unnamed protein product [Pieris macdunnoughi]
MGINKNKIAINTGLSDSNENNIMIERSKTLQKGVKQGERERREGDDTSDDALPFTQLATSLNNIKCVNLKPGIYVIIKYEGEYFPGRIENKDGDLFEISTMVLSTNNTFRWPERPDRIWYRLNDIVEIITSPIKHNNRGFFKVTEMEKFLPNIYT